MGADTTSLAVVKVCLQSYDPFEQPSTLAGHSFLALGDRNSHIWTVVYTNHAIDTFRGVPDRTENTPTPGFITKRCSCRPVSYTHLRAHETRHDLVCRLLLEK